MGQSPGELSASTFRPSRSTGPRRATLPCLTILCHPDITRIGERARLSGLLIGQPVGVSRSQPDFAPLMGGSLRPLEDGFLSRTALQIRAPQGGVEINANGVAVIVDGEPLVGVRRFGPEGMARGIVIELAERVVLMLHAVAGGEQKPLAGLLGQSDAIEHVRREIRRVADLNTPVLVRGETGAGKERVAEAIHALSQRAAGEYVAVNMATIPETVAASTLFGHARGAFTGADKRHRGLFERASGGTLLLDEIGETPSAVQPMLLRVVETNRILPLGEEQERPVDVRMIAATDADLEGDTEAGSFSAALLHRLSGYEILVPPLRERREDIALLLRHFVTEELEQLGDSGRIAASVNAAEPLLRAALVSRLVRHDLPGNVRQLRNVARHLVISNRGEASLSVTPIVERQLRGSASDGAPATVSAPPAGGTARKPSEIGETELLAALRDSAWSPGRAAAMLGIATGTLHDLMRKCPGVRRAADVSDDELRSVFGACAGDPGAMAERLRVSERALRMTLKQRKMIE